MRTILCILCVVVHGGIGRAQEDRNDRLSSNFDACVNEARQNHTERVTDTYYSYQCEGATAERLAARPDQCGDGAKPSQSQLKSSLQQVEDGLYLRMKWRTGMCAGLCEARLYADDREATHKCELHILMGIDDGVSPEPDAGSR